jgi:RNA 2',3'-cyclic 3'-phosphodiesterase
MSRLFTALVPPVAVRIELAGIAAPLSGVRWTPVANLHLTLRFIGETDEAMTERFAEALTRVRVEPFVLPVGSLGVFPSRGPAKVVWAGVGRSHTRLYQLRKQVDETLLAVDSNLPMPGFHPHFTIGRLGGNHQAKELAQYLEKHRDFEAPPFLAAEFHLLASELTPGQPPVYRTVQSYPLAPKVR